MIKYLHDKIFIINEDKNVIIEILQKMVYSESETEYTKFYHDLVLSVPDEDGIDEDHKYQISRNEYSVSVMFLD